ncbi:hypothetical protein ACJMK2_028224 [Sinanodonta woodiana]|uniref:Protein AMN1 homolog n=1 Tax=Sinanodonta woodiana TaxID=1069815 RepID=A0ABD3X6Z1_SINWO
MAATVKYDASAIYGKFVTLLDLCIQTIVNNINKLVTDLENLPPNLKDKCLYLMSKRGLVTDANINKVLYDHLKTLDLSECDVTDKTLQSLCRCPQLRKIDLNAAKQSRITITTEGVRSLAQSCCYLQTVYLRRCLNITDEAIISLSQNCPRLQYLNVGGCQELTDLSLKALGENSSFLQSVNFAQTKVTDTGVVSLVSGCCAESLNEIHMDGCKELTDEAVEAVLQFCPKISILLFHGCPKITEQSRLALEELTIGRAKPMKQVTWTIY